MHSIKRSIAFTVALGWLGACEPTQEVQQIVSPITFSQWWGGMVHFEQGGQFEGEGFLAVHLEVDDGTVEGQIEKQSGDISFANFELPDEGGLVVRGEVDWTEQKMDDATGPCFAGTIYAPLANEYEASLFACVDYYLMLSEMEEEGTAQWRLYGDVDPFFEQAY